MKLHIRNVMYLCGSCERVNKVGQAGRQAAMYICFQQHQPQRWCDEKEERSWLFAVFWREHTRSRPSHMQAHTYTTNICGYSLTGSLIIKLISASRFPSALGFLKTTRHVAAFIAKSKYFILDNSMWKSSYLSLDARACLFKFWLQ